MKLYNVAHGFSLVEMLIASLMSSLLFLAVIQASIYINEQVRAQWLLADFQQRIRFADLWLRSHLMLAGFPGCRQYAALQYFVDPKLSYSTTHFPQFSILTSEVEKTVLPDAILSRAVPESDIIVMSYISPISIHSLLPISSTQWSVKLPSARALPHLFFVDNCRYGVFAKVAKEGKGTDSTLLTDVATRPSDMAPPFYIGEWIREVLYVGFSSRVNQSHDPITALYVSTLTSTDFSTEEMLEGISLMKINENTLESHKSIQIHLLMNAIERMQGINSIYEFNNTRLRTLDQIYRKEIKMSLKLPNINA